MAEWDNREWYSRHITSSKIKAGICEPYDSKKNKFRPGNDQLSGYEDFEGKGEGCKSMQKVRNVKNMCPVDAYSRESSSASPAAVPPQGRQALRQLAAKHKREGNYHPPDPEPAPQVPTHAWKKEMEEKGDEYLKAWMASRGYRNIGKDQYPSAKEALKDFCDYCDRVDAAALQLTA
jgi:hypothetical protein